MDLFSQDLIYQFHKRDLFQTEALKQYSDHAVKEIKSTYGWDTDVQINIEPEAKDKSLFSVSMSVFGLSEPVIIKKNGKQILSVLRKVRKAVMRQIHRLSEKRISHRKSLFTKRTNFTLKKGGFYEFRRCKNIQRRSRAWSRL